MSTRPPLSTAKHDNLPFKSSNASKDGVDVKLKKALASLAEEKRKRAEVEGMVDSLKREREQSKLASISLLQELELARTEIAAQKAIIMRLSAPTTSSSQATVPHGLEAKLQDLMQKHTQAKAKYQTELDDLRSSNTSLQTLISSLTSTTTTDKQTITDLRGERAVLKKELDTIRAKPGPLAKDEKAEEWGRFKEERQNWQKEKMKLEEELKRLKKRLRDNQGLEGRIRELEVEVERLEEGLEVAVKECAVRYMTTVDQEQYTKALEELEIQRSAFGVLTRKSQIQRRMYRDLLGEINELKRQLEESAEDRLQAEEDMRELLEQRQADRQCSAQPPISSLPESTEPLPMGDLLPFVDIALAHISLSSSHSTSHISTLTSSLSSLRTSLESTQTTLSDLRTTHSDLLLTHSKTQAELDSMLQSHSDCAQRILDLRGEASRSGAQEARLKSMLCDTTLKLEEVEERAKSEREMLKRANEGSARWASAKEALEDEVGRLRLALEESRGLQQRYDLVSAELDILRSREAMAVEEADRLSAQNAELIGHGNGVQKISYVDGLRREMALVKHELATTRHNLNQTTSQLQALETEISSYRSIPLSLLASSSSTGRVRVSRRQPEPEGGEVVGAGWARRSVSSSSQRG